ncbi:MAG TPA: F0F1 ATP synthase subunit delta [Opitutaceae bacterium]
MSRHGKATELARTLFKLSLEDGRISSERVGAVLAWVERHMPPRATAVLREYKRLVEEEIARNRAVIEFAGDISPSAFEEIAEAMSRRYGRSIEPVPVPRPELIAGVRVRVGCDIFENSIFSQLGILRAFS